MGTARSEHYSQAQAPSTMDSFDERLQRIVQNGPDGIQDVVFQYFVRNSVAIVAAVSALIFLWAALNPFKSRVPVAVAVKDKKAPSVLLVGPMGSGKTSFFGRLVYNAPPPTHTSMTLSSAVLPEGVTVVDIPGHPRLRSHLLASYLPSAGGVVFCVDPATNASSQGIQATAEHLHTVLALLRTLDEKVGSTARRRRGQQTTLPPLLIMLTKSDTWSAPQKARALDRVRNALERELEKRKQATLGAGASGQNRLESIDELPSGSTGSGLNPFKALTNFFTGSSSRSAAEKASSGSIVLPQDEQEILQSDVLDFDGPFSWDEDKLGISVAWTTSSSQPAKRVPGSADELTSEKEQEGLKGFWDWVDSRV